MTTRSNSSSHIILKFKRTYDFLREHPEEEFTRNRIAEELMIRPQLMEDIVHLLDYLGFIDTNVTLQGVTKLKASEKLKNN